MRYVVILSLMFLMGCEQREFNPERKAATQKLFLECVAASRQVLACHNAAIDLN